jgi:hypothetical protein
LEAGFLQSCNDLKEIDGVFDVDTLSSSLILQLAGTGHKLFAHPDKTLGALPPLNDDAKKQSFTLLTKHQPLPVQRCYRLDLQPDTSKIALEVRNDVGALLATACIQDVAEDADLRLTVAVQADGQLSMNLMDAGTHERLILIGDPQ